MKNSVITAKDLKKSYRMSSTNIVHALNGVDLEVERGAFTAIIGPSGGGKSTLMNMLGLLDRPDSGSLRIDGVDALALKERNAHRIRAEKIGFIFQGFNLIPTLTALENVMIAGKYGGMDVKQRRERAGELMTLVGLGDRMHHRPSELSGGQQQRVAIARSLVNNPAIVLADEPTGELDTKTSMEIMEILMRLNKENGQTFLIVTHNMEVAESCEGIVKLRDGKVE